MTSAPSGTQIDPQVHGVVGRSSRVEFRYLDGLRGVAALAVMVYHALEFTASTGDGSRQLRPEARIIGYGYLGVPVFIVLSGYVLMLPVLRSPDLQIPGGALRYLRRRARRILPPYYATLVLVLALIVTIPLLRQTGGTAWDSKIPVTRGAVVSHFLLLHDMRPSWIGKIDGPMWSVAVEWQLYFLMPLALLPLWRRLRPVLVVAVLLLVTVLPSELAIGPTWLIGTLDSAHVWMLALFAAGMLAAQVTLDATRRMNGLKMVTAVAVAGLVAALAIHPALQHMAIISETCTGLVVALLLACSGRQVLAGDRPLHVCLLEARAPMQLGLISYSVYLLHSPLLALANLSTRAWGLPVLAQWALLTFVAIPVAIFVCVGFYWLVERRFKNTRQRHAAAELSGAAPRFKG